MTILGSAKKGKKEILFGWKKNIFNTKGTLRVQLASAAKEHNVSSEKPFVIKLSNF